MPELSLTRHDGVARVTIDRPERKHAWSASMWAEMAGLMGKVRRGRLGTGGTPDIDR